MSNVSTVYDRILTELNTLFPAKTRIPYPYSLVDNQSQFLIDGYGLKIGSGGYEQLEYCSFTANRTISIVVTREAFRLDSNVVAVDDIVKLLLEDIHTIQKNLYELDATNGNSNEIIKVDIGAVSGVQEITTNTKFLSMEAEFNFLITDTF